MTTPISLSGQTDSQSYTTVDHKDYTTPSGYVFNKTLVQNGDNPIDRFSISKLIPATTETKDSVILLLPGSNMNFDSYLIGDNPLIAKLAKQGYPVYGCDMRTEHTSFPSDIFNEDTQSWGFDTYIKDIEYTVAQIQKDYPGKKILLGGMSIGAITTFAAANKNPDLYDGLILIDGTLYSEDEGFVETHEKLCDNYTSQIESGIYLDAIYGAGFRGFKTLAEATKNIPVLNATQTALWQSLTTQVAGFHKGHTFATPGEEPLTYKYSTEENLNKLIDRLNNLQPHAVYTDYTCAIGEPTEGLAPSEDPKTKFIDNLGAYTKPIFAISAEQGYGPYIEDGLNLFGSAQKGAITHYMREGVSHIDLLTASDQNTMLNNDLLAWLEQNGF